MIHEHPSSLDLEQIQYTERLTVYDAPIGSSIVGIPTLKALDALVTVSRDTKDLMTRGNWRANGTNNLPGRHAQELFRKKRFNGKVSQIEITRIPFDNSLLEGPSGTALQTKPLFSILTGMTLSSTGRGTIGRLLLETTYAVGYNQTSSFDVFRHRLLNSSNDTTVIEALIRDSQTEFTLAQRRALRNIAIGGLPSLGKR